MDTKRNYELIKQIAENDMSSLAQLYKDNYNDLYAYALSILKNPSLAEDVIHDVFIKIRISSQNFRTNANAWILKITRNTALDLIKKRKRESYEFMDGLVNMDYSSNSYDLIFLRDALEALNTTEREIVILHLYSGFQHMHIAKHLRLPLTTVKWKYHTAIKKLKKLLDE